MLTLHLISCDHTYCGVVICVHVTFLSPLKTPLLPSRRGHTLHLVGTLRLRDPIRSCRSIQFRQRLRVVESTYVNDVTRAYDLCIRIRHLALPPQRRATLATEDGRDGTARVGLGGVLLGSTLDLEVCGRHNDIGAVGRAGDVLAVAAMADGLSVVSAVILRAEE